MGLVLDDLEICIFHVLRYGGCVRLPNVHANSLYVPSLYPCFVIPVEGCFSCRRMCVPLLVPPGCDTEGKKQQDAPVGIWTRVEGLRVPNAWPGYTTGASMQIVKLNLLLFLKRILILSGTLSVTKLRKELKLNRPEKLCQLNNNSNSWRRKRRGQCGQSLGL